MVNKRLITRLKMFRINCYDHEQGIEFKSDWELNRGILMSKQIGEESGKKKKRNHTCFNAQASQNIPSEHYKAHQGSDTPFTA